MNRKLVGGASILVLFGLVAGWFLWRRGDDRESGGGAGSAARTGKLEGSAATPPPKRDGEIRGGGPGPRWSLDADREGPLRLEGQVVDADGKGVGGAQVWLASVPPRQATAEDDGTFAFEKLVGRTYSVSAKRGAAIGGPVSYKLTATSDPVKIVVAEGAAVIVTVVDEAQRPIAGAEVRGSGLAEKAAVTTDAKGAATLTPVHPGYVAATATASGFAPGGGFTTIGSAGAVGELTITLRKGVPVAGRVIDEAGKPIAKVKVSLDGWWFGDDNDDDAKTAAITDAKGEFTIPAVAAGTHKLIAVDGAHAPATSEPVTVADRPVAGVTIAMKDGGALTGLVVDTAGKPVANATVRVAGTGQQMWMVAARQVTCDEKGAFELRGLARAKLQARAESEQAASRLIDVNLVEMAKQELKLVLDVEGVISGKVVDDHGAAVAEIQVNAFPDFTSGESLEGFALAGMSSAMTNGAGEFAIRGLPNGAYRLSPRRTAGDGWWGARGTPAKTGDRNVILKLPALGGVKGKIVIEGAGAPKSATVQLGFQAPVPARDGAFEIKDVSPESHDVVIRGSEFAELVQRGVKVEPGKVTDLGTLMVRRGRRLSGKVVDAKGQGVAGVKVKLGEMLFSLEGQEALSGNFEDMGGVRSAVTGPDGSFAITGVPPKGTTVAAIHDEHGRSLGVAVAAGTDDPPPVTLTLRGFGSIKGKVVMKGAPQPGVNVIETSKDGGSQMAMATTNERGEFTFAKVIEGAHVLRAMLGAPGTMKSATEMVTVTAGQQAAVTIDFPVGSVTLTVQPKALAGQTVDAAQIFLFAGAASPATGKQVQEAFLQGSAQGMQIWFGPGKPAPQFKEVVPGDYSICTIPISGDLSDPAVQRRLQEHGDKLKVYCRRTPVAAEPLQQSIVHEVPAMTPLPS